MAEMIQQMDFRILDWIQENLRTPWLDWFAPKITFLGNGGWFWILLTVLLLGSRRHRRCAITMMAGLVLCGVALVLLKNGFARARPCWINTEIDLLIPSPKDYSFPSGHSAAGHASSLILLFHDKRAGIPAVILAVLIALSRLYLYVHFPTDVLAGILLGILAALTAQQIVQRVQCANPYRTQDKNI